MHYLPHLGKDKQLRRLIESYTGEPLRLQERTDIPLYLCASIMSQQLSTKVAAVIYQRFLNLYGGLSPRPEEILSTPAETLRGVGLSNAKVSYVQNVARFSLEKGMDHATLASMGNEEVIVYLTQIKGVGRWTVEMLLMFGLGREDVFSIDDLGVQNAMIHLYKLDRTDKKGFRQQLLEISEKWSPYRTYACMHLWRWKDNSPVVGKKAVAPNKAAAKKAAVKKKAATKAGKAAKAKETGRKPAKKAAKPKTAKRTGKADKKPTLRGKKVGKRAATGRKKR